MTIWQSSEFDNHEQVCFFTDEDTGLKAVVAIHSTHLGPACGGTRFKTYERDELAVDDALRLSRAMSYKSALAGMPVGGGKAVIIGDPAAIKSTRLLHAYAHFINRIGQNFATGEDVGISVADMDAMAEITPFVGGTSQGVGDPSIHTAVGVLHGLRAVLSHRFGTEDFSGVRVAIQGLGAVGWGVAERLRAEGAELVVADIRSEQVERAAAAFGASVEPTETIHRSSVDIFSPCALGGGITIESADEIKARAVAGAANNQLATAAAGERLLEREILFAPDYVINAGGIISGLEAATKMPGRPAMSSGPLDERLAAIHDRLLSIFARSRDEGRPPEVVSEQLARELIGR